MIETGPYTVVGRPSPPLLSGRRRTPMLAAAVLALVLAFSGTALAVTLANSNGSSTSVPNTSVTAKPSAKPGYQTTPGTGGNTFVTTPTAPAAPNYPTTPGTGGNAPNPTVRPSDDAAQDDGGDARDDSEAITDDTVISTSSPTIGITHLGDIVYVIEKTVFNLFRGAVDGLMGLCAFMMGIMGSAMDPLLTGSFSGGAFDRLYVVAQEVSHTVGVPFGTAICGMSFMVAMVESSERARRYEAKNPVMDVAMLVLALVVGIALIYNAVNLCAFIYTLCTNVVHLLQRALEAVGVSSVGWSVSETLQSSVTGSMDRLTYGEVGMSLLYVFVALAMAIMCAGVMTHVILQALLRMGEVYLRAAFSPVVIGFAAAKSTRPMAVQYLKRFAAVSLNAALIILALALAGLLFSVTSDVIGPIVASQADGVRALVGGLVPTAVAVTAVSALVKRSESISASVFGLN